MLKTSNVRNILHIFRPGKHFTYQDLVRGLHYDGFKCHVHIEPLGTLLPMTEAGLGQCPSTASVQEPAPPTRGGRARGPPGCFPRLSQPCFLGLTWNNGYIHSSWSQRLRLTWASLGPQRRDGANNGHFENTAQTPRVPALVEGPLPDLSWMGQWSRPEAGKGRCPWWVKIKPLSSRG